MSADDSGDISHKYMESQPDTSDPKARDPHAERGKMKRGPLLEKDG